jgi:hypothetical protein
MTAALISPNAPRLPVSIAAARRHAALARALLADLDRLTPQPSASAREYILGDQLIEELTRLGYELLECAATMAASRSEAPALARCDVDPQQRSAQGPAAEPSVAPLAALQRSARHGGR